MDKSTITVKELPEDTTSAQGSQPPSLASSRNNSSTYSQPSSTRHSCEAPTSPFCTIHSQTQPLDTASVLKTAQAAASIDSDTPPPYEPRRKASAVEERKRDYSMWLSRMMGKQLVKGLGGAEKVKDNGGVDKVRG